MHAELAYTGTCHMCCSTCLAQAVLSICERCHESLMQCMSHPQQLSAMLQASRSAALSCLVGTSCDHTLCQIASLGSYLEYT
jgi:hypothetical protein